MTYEEFLQSKILLSENGGFKISKSEVNPLLKPHQIDTVVWDIAGGRRANFLSFGLGKTFIQIEVMRIIGKKENGRQLIIMPLGVRQEFKEDAKKLNVELVFVNKTNQVEGDGIYITNYESVRDGKLDVDLFNAVSLDEASVLRSYGSKTYQNFLQLFSSIKYRFVNTATPSPNKNKELIHYAGYLGVMDTGQALTRFFKRDSTKANNLQLHHATEKEFWLWVSSWALFLQKPSDLGYSDEGYDLPELNVIEHRLSAEVRITCDRYGQYSCIQDASLGVKEASKEKRESIDVRVSEMKSIISDYPDDHFIFWHDQEIERRAIRKAVPDVSEVYGSLDLETREQRIIDFSYGKTKYLSTKPILSGSGCNFQRYCNNAIFVGIGFKFNDFIQAVHRICRFLQTKQCNIHIIYMDTEDGVFKTLMHKWQQHKETVEKMSEIIRKYGLSHSAMFAELKRTMGVERVESKSELYTAVLNDTVIETKNMPSNSVDLIHTSIPFANHYEYTASYHDFGHNTGNGRFFDQMDYLTPELLRVLKPGRIAAIHVKDRVLFGNVTGYGFPTMDDFHVECSQHFKKHGFKSCGMITVVTDVVRENNQTYRLGWSEMCKDGTKMGVGCPEYILLFRKLQTDTGRGYSDEPVSKDKKEYSRAKWQTDAHAFWRSSGDRLLNAEEMSAYPTELLSSLYTKFSMAHVYDYDHHVKVGELLDLKDKLPADFMCLAPGSNSEMVWHDVTRMRTLNGEQAQRNLNLHICPLQFDIVDRIITRFSNKGELIFDPFAGLFTVPYRAILLGRRGIGTELNPQSYFDGLSYLRAAETEFTMPSLFDFENIKHGELIEKDTLQ
jgi:hypothetical protein